MTDDKDLYLAFIAVLIAFLFVIIAIIVTQPVKLSFEADVVGTFGDITTVAKSDSPPVTVPSLEFKNPLNGKSIELYNGTEIGMPTVKINSSFDGFNVTAHIKGNIEAPVYVLVLAAMSNTTKGLT